MGNLNFQDEKSEQGQQAKPSESNPEEERVEDIFVDEPTSGTKILWVAIAVVVIAGIAGAFYFLNSRGYLKFGKKATVTEATQSAPAAMQAADTSEAAEGGSGAAGGSATTGKYSLQVSAFRTRAQADRYIAQLSKKGIEAYAVVGSDRNGRQWFRVCVGSFPNRIQAIAAIEGMKKRVGTDVWVVPAQ